MSNGGARKRSEKLTQLQDMADAIRHCLGLDPLERQRPKRTHLELETERFHRPLIPWSNPLDDGYTPDEPLILSDTPQVMSGRYFWTNPFEHGARRAKLRRKARSL